MSEKIPEDVRAAAEAVVNRGYNEGLVDAVCRAIMAERDRCAKIAENFSWVLPMYENAVVNEATDNAACMVQEQVAAAIRGTDA